MSRDKTLDFKEEKDKEEDNRMEYEFEIKQ